MEALWTAGRGCRLRAWAAMRWQSWTWAPLRNSLWLLGATLGKKTAAHVALWQLLTKGPAERNWWKETWQKTRSSLSVQRLYEIFRFTLQFFFFTLERLEVASKRAYIKSRLLVTIPDHRLYLNVPLTSWFMVDFSSVLGSWQRWNSQITL